MMNLAFGVLQDRYAGKPVFSASHAVWIGFCRRFQSALLRVVRSAGMTSLLCSSCIEHGAFRMLMMHRTDGLSFGLPVMIVVGFSLRCEIVVLRSVVSAPP